jgi:transcriptional regulator with XRE-family HTH domain
MAWKFGQYIEKLLNKKGWKASELAKKAGLSHVYIGQLLRGNNPDTGKPPRVSVDTLQSISRALNIPESKLFLAYKGIDPDKDDDTETEEFDLQKEINVAIINCGYDLNQFSPEETKQIAESIANISRKFIQIIVEYEIERMKKQSSMHT